MPRSFAGAVALMKAKEESPVMPPAVSADSGGVLATGIDRILSPVLPPAVVSVVASPIVILEALAKALASSGQALIIPGFAFLFGFGVPGARRRVDQAINGA
ncbi:MAG TPA: hypothetical protein VJP05_01235 [Acidimicrobiia bacterium]|nr:hypothetical protein [Acidimicrobiia bacterium]